MPGDDLSKFIGLREGQVPEEFNWRHYLKDSEVISEKGQALLDQLTEMVNTPDGDEFKDGLKKGAYKGGVLAAFLGYYRSVLTDEERSALGEEVRNAGRSYYMGPKELRG